MPSGTVPDGFEELAIVGAKDGVWFAADATGSAACTLKASTSIANVANVMSFNGFTVTFPLSSFRFLGDLPAFSEDE
jgi:hypothetical protein